MLKKLFFSFVVLMTMSTMTMAQEEGEFKPHWFLGAQGGVQNTFNSEFNNLKTFTPTATLSFGRWFVPEFGARLSLNGAWNKSGVDFCTGQPDEHYRYNYVTPNVDALVNLCTLFGKKDSYPVNLIFVGGLGANYAFENYYRAEEKAALPFSSLTNADNDSRWAFNGRVGLMLDIPVCKAVSLNLEGDLNGLWAGKVTAFNRDCLQMTAQAGITFHFGCKKAKEPEVWETRIDTTWYDEKEYVDVTRDRELKKEIFFEIREDSVDTSFEQIKAVAEFLKGVKNAEIKIAAYADRETGNPKINMGYSKGRALNTQRALVQCGVDPAIIKSVEWFGDTVQPYAENDKNRVSIITGHGIYTDKDPKINRKFRTEEVRYRVK